jgi:Bacterial protein of unknown function (DUF922)
MKQLLPFIFLIVCTVPAGLHAQNVSADNINWSAARRLTWADYIAPPDPESNAAASTTTLLTIDYKISNNSFSYKIQSYFSKSRSWGRHKDAYILSHEQGHFDIAEIFARKLNKAMSEYVFNGRTYQKELKKIYETVTDEKEDLQNEYDRDTNHSINKVKQAEWLKKIEQMLKEYENFSDY